jgi:hypothetical protein
MFGGILELEFIVAFNRRHPKKPVVAADVARQLLLGCSTIWVRVSITTKDLFFHDANLAPFPLQSN